MWHLEDPNKWQKVDAHLPRDDFQQQTSAEVQQGAGDRFIVKKKHRPIIQDGAEITSGILFYQPPINYFTICLVIQDENPNQNEWDVSFMQLLVKALQGVKSRLDLNWSQQYRIRSNGGLDPPQRKYRSRGGRRTKDEEYIVQDKLTAAWCHENSF